MKVSQSGPILCKPWTVAFRPFCPWNSPGQNTEVGSLSLLQRIFPTLGSNLGLLHGRQILLPAEPQGKPKNTGVGSLSLFQGNFPTQESNQGLLHCRQILYQLSYEGSPKSKSLCHVQLFATPQTIWILQARILEWIAIPFSRGSSPPRTGIQVSSIAGRFFIIWATREAWGE